MATVKLISTIPEREPIAFMPRWGISPMGGMTGSLLVGYDQRIASIRPVYQNAKANVGESRHPDNRPVCARRLCLMLWLWF
jgi:hypothetical protein